MLSHYLRLLAHMTWADRRVLERLTTHCYLKHEIVLLSHVLAAERVWLARLEGADSTGVEVWPTLTLAECEASIVEMATRWRGYLEGLEEGAAGQVSYRRGDGVEFTSDIADVLTHVFMHGAYHRGQIARGIRESDHEPVNTDFITFAREENRGR